MSNARKHCLLVVDDEPEICNSVRDLLHAKFRVVTAHSAAEAIDLMGREEIEIVMTDQRMPEITGVEMLQRVKNHFPAAVRMLFTGYSDIKSVVAAINQGHVYRYLSKPWQPEDLVAAVTDAAVEYDGIVAQTREIARCHERIAELEREVQDLRTRAGLSA